MGGEGTVGDEWFTGGQDKIPAPGVLKSSGRDTLFTKKKNKCYVQVLWANILHLIVTCYIGYNYFLIFNNFHLSEYSTWYLVYIRSSRIFVEEMKGRREKSRRVYVLILECYITTNK